MVGWDVQQVEGRDEDSQNILWFLYHKKDLMVVMYLIENVAYGNPPPNPLQIAVQKIYICMHVPIYACVYAYKLWNIYRIVQENHYIYAAYDVQRFSTLTSGVFIIYYIIKPSLGLTLTQVWDSYTNHGLFNYDPCYHQWPNQKAIIHVFVVFIIQFFLFCFLNLGYGLWAHRNPIAKTAVVSPSLAMELYT